MDRGLWLGQFQEPVAIRKEASLHLYTCSDAASGQRRLVVLGAPGTETSSVAATLDAIARGHQLIDHPRVPRVVSRDRVGEIEFLAFGCDAVIDFSQLQAEVARQAGRGFQYGKGVAVYRMLLEALAVAHRAVDPVHGGPLVLGRWSWANILLSDQAELWLWGFGRPRRPGTPWVVPEATETAAPEVKLGTRVTESADLGAIFVLFMSTISMVQLPPVLERIMAGARDHADAEIERLFNDYQNASMALGPRDRHQSVAEAIAALDKLSRAMDSWVEPEEFRLLARPVVERMRSRDQVTSPGKPAAERLNVPACVAGRYRVERLLGEGGMGRVFLAWDRQLRQQVALKLSTASGNPDQQQRFLREVRIARQVRHPHLVHGYDLVFEEGSCFAVIEYVAGERLDAHFAAHPDPAAAQARLSEIADALASLHRMGIVHRDVKPSNILVNPERGAVLLDYGIASEAGSELTRTGAALGTPQFMAPEQASGAPVGPPCDVYSLGMVARGLFATAPPPGIADLLARCLAAAPEARPTMDELALGLSRPLTA